VTVGVLALVGAAVGVAGAASAEDASNLAAVEALSPDLEQNQGRSDALPSFLVSGDQALPGIRPETSRALGEEDGVTYWIAVNDLNEGCLIALMPGDDRFASMSCVDGDAAWENGLALQVQDQDQAIRAYFLPDGYSADIPESEEVGEQLLVTSAEEAARDLTAYPSSSEDEDLKPIELIELPAADGSIG
jgi:hypothetical protein